MFSHKNINKKLTRTDHFATKNSSDEWAGGFIGHVMWSRMIK